MRCARSLPFVMAVPPMQSISGDDDGTYVSHIMYYGPPHGLYAWFAMPAMFGASATDRGWLLFRTSCVFGVRLPSHNMHLRHMPCLFWCGFLHLTWVGTVLGELNLALHPQRVGVGNPNYKLYPLTNHEFVRSLGLVMVREVSSRLLLLALLVSDLWHKWHTMLPLNCADTQCCP